MGITSISLQRISRYIQPKSNILIIGCQNIYSAENYGEIAQDYFSKRGHNVLSIDIYECNGATVADLRMDLTLEKEFDIILQHGTVEHVDGGLYQPFKNIHEGCGVGGIMIHENPKTENWPGHGQHYFTEQFYIDFAISCNYNLLEVTTEAAMGNVTDGWNISSVLQKVDDKEFITEQQFNEIYAKHIFSK